MKNMKLFKIASIFALALLVGFVFTAVNVETSTANSLETTISVDATTSLAALSLDVEKCGDGKTKEDKKKTKKKKTSKKKDCDTKTKKKNCDTKTTKCGGGC